MGRVTRRHTVQRLQGEQWSRRPDRLAVEEPLEIRIGGTPFAVTMRTPGDDIDLVHGYLHAETVITAAADIASARYCLGTGPDGLNTYNVIDVSLAPGVAAPDPGLARNVLTSSACGICGSTTIDAVMERALPALSSRSFPAELIRSGPDLLRAAQPTFERTGGVHAAGLLTVGEDGAPALDCVREDVGRHNAVDKVIGWALREGRLPLDRHVLMVSGRASFELTQKAVQAGIGVLAAVSAPSSLAVELAERTGLTLIGFVRGGSMNVYTGPERIDLPVPAATASSG